MLLPSLGFLAFYVAIFVPGLINDVRMVRNIPYDGVVLSLLCAACIYDCIVHRLDALLTLTGVVSLVIGLYLASAERFLVGAAFHSTTDIELWHESYHEQLRLRKRTKCYLRSDHLLEVVAYAVVFSFYLLLFYLLGVEWHSSQCFVWLGIVTEHYVGQKLRLHVQYAAPGAWKGSAFEKLLVNAEVYYWYHIVVDPSFCWGFSSPWWDSLFGKNPFASRWAFSSPLPIVDFLVVDYSEHLPRIHEAFERYNKNPQQFLADMKESIARRRQ